MPAEARRKNIKKIKIKRTINAFNTNTNMEHTTMPLHLYLHSPKLEHRTYLCGSSRCATHTAMLKKAIQNMSDNRVATHVSSSADVSSRYRQLSP